MHDDKGQPIRAVVIGASAGAFEALAAVLPASEAAPLA
jgi:chemotaxis response regulator CheB